MSILSSLLGKDSAKASKAAAADTYAKQQAATAGLTSYADTLPDAYSSLATNYAPYSSAGDSALKRLLSGLGLDGGDGSDFTSAYRSLPGYQAGLDTGTKAAITAANAGGMTNSGKTLKALERFGSDYEDQKSGDYLTRLMGLTGLGASAAGATAGLGAQGLGAQAGLRGAAFNGDMTSAGTIGQGLVAGEQAKQSALTNLLGVGSFLAGSYLGGRGGTAAKPPGIGAGSNNSSISPFGAGIGPFRM